MENIKKELDEEKTRYVEIDFDIIHSKEELLQVIEEQFSLPYTHNNWDTVEDWLTDLSWIEENSICVSLLNFYSFCKREKELGEIFSSMLQEGVLPFWEEEAPRVIVGGKVREFEIYVIN